MAKLHRTASDDLQQELARLREENLSLRMQLEDSQATLRAIREGTIDALVIDTPHGQRVFTLQGGEHPYRALIEQMREGAVTLTPDGIIHYCNQYFADLLKMPLERVMGARLADFVAPADRAVLTRMLRRGTGRAELNLLVDDAGELLPALASAASLEADGPAAVCLAIADLSERRRHDAEIRQLNKDLEKRVVQRTAQLATANRRLKAEIAERKQAEHEREAAHSQALSQNSRLEAVMETLPVGLAILDAHGSHLRSNRMFEQIWGGPRPEVGTGADYGSYKGWWADSGKRVQPHEWGSARAMRNGETVIGQTIEIERFDGGRAVIINSAAPVFDAHGTISGCVVANQDITEHVRAKELLRQSEEQYRLAIKATNDAIWDLNLTTGVVRWNETYATLFGRPVETADSWQWWLEHIHPDDRERTLHSFRAALQGQETAWSAEYRFQRPDGSWADVFDRAFIAREPSGKAWRVVGAMLDLTERKHAEEELRESEERLRLHVENTPLAVIEWGPDFRIARWSAEAERIFGWNAEEVLGKRINEFRWVFGEDAGVVGRVSEGLLGSGSLRSVSHNRNYRKDGSVVHCEWYNSALLDASGNLRSILSLVLDVTERVRAEERTRLLSDVTTELLAAEQPQQSVEVLCRRVMDHLGCQVFFSFLVDEQENCLRLNAYAGVPAEVARQFDTLEKGAAVCGCVAREGCRLVADDVQKATDPRTAFVRRIGVQAYACHPLMNQGKAIGTLSFGSRLKSRFDADELGLMKTVADHVAIAMQRIRLLKSLENHARAAEAANEAKSQFLANMSHELRTPMNAILGLIDVARPKANVPIVQDCLNTAKEAAVLLLTLLNDLLDSARIESGKLELEAAPFSLRRMLDQITQILSVRASEKGLSFYCRVPKEVPQAVVGDRMRLQQVLLNLAGNAIKFTASGDVEIHVECVEDANSTPGTSNLRFAVRDTGIGIAPSRLGAIFLPFAQADASMSRRFGGTGLGLSICRSLVELMGGRVWVESELGRGSTFYFTVSLPLAKEPADEKEAPMDLSAPPAAPLRVLLVEDNPANQKLVTFILQERGHAVDVAGDGPQALNLTEVNPYDVILMDVQMPGVDGLETTAAIRAREGGQKHMPIIAITAHAMKGDRERCLAAGMDGYLSKPIDAREMIALIEGLASGQTPAEQATEAAKLPKGPAPGTVFDQELALKRCARSKQMLNDMVQYFFDEMHNLMPRMREAFQAGQLSEVGRLGHRLKGTIVYLGAKSAEKAAIAVEEFCGGGVQKEQAEEAVRALERECETLRKALTTGRLDAEHRRQA